MKELLNYIGVEVNENEEPKWHDVKKVFDEKFIPKSQIMERDDIIKPIKDQAYGEAMKRAEIAFQTGLKKTGLDITHSEFDQFQRAEEKFDFGLKKLAETVKLQNDGIDEATKQKLQDLQSEADRFKNEYGTVKNQFDEFRAQVEEREKQRVINDYQDKLFSSIKWKENANDLEKTGFREVFKSQYKFVLNDDNNIELRTKDGERIANPERADEYLKPEQIVEKAAKDAGVWNTKPHEGKPNPERRRPDQIVDTEVKVNRNPNAGMKRRPRFNAMG